MAKVVITSYLEEEINTRFRGESVKIFHLLKSLENNPKKGDFVGSIGNIAIKELRHKGFRFYFLLDGHKVKVLSCEELEDLLIKFVRMSDKNSQQKVINEIKELLRKLN
jgi:hypothetical protein